MGKTDAYGLAKQMTRTKSAKEYFEYDRRFWARSERCSLGMLLDVSLQPGEYLRPSFMAGA